MFVEIITIGDEILIGQVIDTNSAWIGKELNNAGFEVNRITSVRDREDEIYEAIDSAMKRNNIVIMTGGLGPTKDDITKKVLCNYFHSKLVLDNSVLKNVESLLSQRNIGLIQSNRDQGLVPECATIIQNTVGTAPVMWFDSEDKVLISLPGVPQEMKKAMSEEVIPRLKKRFITSSIFHQTFLVINNPESLLAKRLEDWEDHLPSCIKLAYLPQQNLIRLRLTARGEDERYLQHLMDEEVKKLFAILKKDILPEKDASLNQLIGQILREKGKTLSTSESCSGGSIAASITSVPGSSDYFLGSIVAYSNEVKQNLLEVKAETLQVYGAVSEHTVIEMAKGGRDLFNSTYSIATTGIAGPGGGSPEKPVGTIWIAVASEDKIITQKLSSDRGRESNILRTVNSALILLYEELMKEKEKEN